MKPDQFCYWLQGFFEVSENSDNKEIILTQKQINVIRAHLNLVFFHSIDPENLKDSSGIDKIKYQKIHDGAKSGESIKKDMLEPFEPFPKAYFEEHDDLKIKEIQSSEKLDNWIPDYSITYNC